MNRNLLILIVGIFLMFVAHGPNSASTSDRLPPTVQKVRTPAVAGSWYPGKADLLSLYLDGMLEKAVLDPALTDQASIRALILPHAGYQFSGSTAAAGLKQVMGRKYKRVVVIGPAHRFGFTGLSIADVTHYETPLGLIPLDLEAKAALVRQSMVRHVNDAHYREHSIEMELPMLQRALEPGWKLVPILVGDMDADGFAMAARQIKFLLDSETLLVISGDFTHYGPNYDYKPFANDGKIAKKLRSLDIGLLKQLAARDSAGMLAYRAKTGITACGLGPMVLLANLMPEESRLQLVQYQTSGRITDDYTNSVSYLAVAVIADAPFHATKKNEAVRELSEADLIILHKMAKKALEVAVKNGPKAVSAEVIAAEFDLPEHFRDNSGAFVTLKREGRLRGCIGFIKPVKPLYQAVIDNAVNAALMDHRFIPVRPLELPLLELEVSVLSPMRSIPSFEGFEVGKHGVVLSKSGRSAVFLPEVAIEQGWSREETLTQLSRKAGLSGDAWKKDSSFKIFTAQKYSAPYIADH